METTRLAFSAMATRFEILVLDADPVHARAAAEEAKREIQRIESQCSFYSPASELSRINREAADGPVRCTAGMMRLLQTCQSLHRATGGYFDPTVAPALARWGLRHRGDAGRVPSEDERSGLVASMGFDAIELNAANRTVRFLRPDRQLDLGGIAKGWALDEARMLLEESGVENALLHGGTSTAIGMGNDPEGHPWKIGVEDPYDVLESPSWILTIPLHDEALSVSGVQGKSFVDETGETRVEYGHVMDPLTGMAVSGRRLALALSSSAAVCDAWSTALLTQQHSTVPETVTGTALLKTDSGWTVAAGRILSEWHHATDFLPSPDQPS